MFCSVYIFFAVKKKIDIYAKADMMDHFIAFQVYLVLSLWQQYWPTIQLDNLLTELLVYFLFTDLFLHLFLMWLICWLLLFSQNSHAHSLAELFIVDTQEMLMMAVWTWHTRCTLSLLRTVFLYVFMYFLFLTVITYCFVTVMLYSWIFTRFNNRQE